MTDRTAAEIFKQAMNMQQQNPAQAAVLFQQVLQLDPNHVDALQSLAGIRFHSGDIAGVVPLLQRAVALRPGDFALQSNLATVLAMLGQFGPAIIGFRAAAALSPDSADTWLHLGLALQQSNRLNESEPALLRAVALDPAHTPVLGVLGRSMFGAGKLTSARSLCERAVAFNADDYESRFALGCALHHLGQVDSAIREYQRVIASKPDYVGAHFNLGKAADTQKNYPAAIAHYRRALEIDPNHAGARNNLALALGGNLQFDEALRILREILQRQPDNAEAHNNLGSALHQTGHYEAAREHLATALKLNPTYASAEWNMAIVLLSKGEFREGFRAYESRLKLPRTVPMLTFAQPMWDGSSLAGRTILLHSEQGYGDSLQFIRYAPLLRERGANVLLICPENLSRLLARMPSISTVCISLEALPHFDVHCPLGSIPYRFGTTLETIPNPVPYIHADPAIAGTWKQRLNSLSAGFRVGLVWAGSPEHENDANRSLSLEALAGIAMLEGISFVGLQKGAAANQATPPGMRFQNLGNELTDFADTAAVISQLDLVVAVDTSVAHLAGAMGKPTWVLLPEPADWRWMLERTDSPWYPTMRLFRQPTRGDWASPLRELADALRQFRDQFDPLPSVL